MTSETSPEEGPSGFPSGTTTYSYTASGGGLCAGAASAVCSRTDARGTTTTYTYDAENRLTGKSYNDTPQTPAVNYYYDQTSYNGLTITNGLGRRTGMGMADGSGQTAWSYNTKGEVLTEQRTIGTVTKTISYTYNSDGSPTSITYPNGGAVGYGYNSAGQLNSVSGQLGSTPVTWASVSAFAANGSVSTVNLDGDTGSYGDAVNYTYDVRFRPSRVQVTNLTGGGTQMDLSYAYYQNSNVHVVTNNLDNTRTATYAYDNLNRLSTASSQATSGANCWGQSFGYDRYGNLTAINSTQCSSPTMSVTVNAKNQVTNSGFTYDSGGNLTADGTYTYAWDGENRLASTNGVTYTYDGDGKRVKKSSGTIYWYDLGGNVIEETDGSGNRVSAFIYFNGKRVGRYDPSGAHYAYLTDLLGSSMVMTNSLGYIQDSSDYYPFGGERVVTSSLTDHYKFTGMERDTESGLDHTLFRQFTSTYGRWLSPDPLAGHFTNPQSLNRYAYVENNPPNFADPLGLFMCWDPTINNFCGAGGSGSGGYGGIGGGGEGGSGGQGGPCVEVRLAFARESEVYNCGNNPGGGGGGSGDKTLEAFNKVKDIIAKVAATQSVFTASELDCISAIETGCTFNQSIVSSNGIYFGLFQFNEQSWHDSRTSIPWSGGQAALFAYNAAAVALSYLYVKLGYSGLQNPTPSAVQGAIDRFGDHNERYGEAVMKCASKLDSGDFSGAMQAVHDYSNWKAAH